MPDKQDVTKLTRDYRTPREDEFPERLPVVFSRLWGLRYGENPCQLGAVFSIAEINGIDTSVLAEATDIVSVRSDGKGKGGLSLTNTLDIGRAMDDLKFFRGEQAVVIMKHNIVSGFARQSPLEARSQIDLFRLSRDADRLSNFGGTAVFTRPLERETAEAMYELEGESTFFVDVVAAPGYDHSVVSYLEGKKNDLRIAEFSGLDKLPRFQGDDTRGLYSFKEIPGGMMGIQDLYLTSIKTADDLILRPYVVTKGDNPQQVGINRKPTSRELEDLLTSWWLNISGARSNGIVFVRDGVSVAIGSGQVARVEAVNFALMKGIHKAMAREGITFDPLYGIQGYEQLKDNPFKAAVGSSDAFFPFRDSIDSMQRLGVSAVIQPYGSNRDVESIEAANKYDMAMVCTGERGFGHF
ncbi:MAG: hypothetical protein ABIH37_00335 [archaeon]